LSNPARWPGRPRHQRLRSAASLWGSLRNRKTSPTCV
jgi:hypothetical protein